MKRAERRLAEREGRVVCTPMEADYFLGESDVSRLATLRFHRGGMRFPAGGAPHLVDDFEQHAVAMSFRYQNEQIYLTRESRLPTAFWPERWCQCFKHSLMPRFPANWWRDAPLPADARIVVFTGRPRPHEAIAAAWPAPWFKKHYKKIRPVRWMKDHWV